MTQRSTDWIGVDLDRTLARRVSGDPLDRVGDPVPAMLDRVGELLRRVASLGDDRG